MNMGALLCLKGSFGDGETGMEEAIAVFASVLLRWSGRALGPSPCPLSEVS